MSRYADDEISLITSRHSVNPSTDFVHQEFSAHAKNVCHRWGPPRMVSVCNPATSPGWGSMRQWRVRDSSDVRMDEDNWPFERSD